MAEQRWVRLLNMIGLLKYKDNGLNICGADGCKSPTRTPSLKAFSQIYASVSALFLCLTQRIYELFCFIATFSGPAPHLGWTLAMEKFLVLQLERLFPLLSNERVWTVMSKNLILCMKRIEGGVSFLISFQKP